VSVILKKCSSQLHPTLATNLLTKMKFRACSSARTKNGFPNNKPNCYVIVYPPHGTHMASFSLSRKTRSIHIHVHHCFFVKPNWQKFDGEINTSPAVEQRPLLEFWIVATGRWWHSITTAINTGRIAKPSTDWDTARPWKSPLSAPVPAKATSTAQWKMGRVRGAVWSSNLSGCVYRAGHTYVESGSPHTWWYSWHDEWQLPHRWCVHIWHSTRKIRAWNRQSGSQQPSGDCDRSEITKQHFNNCRQHPLR